MENGSNEDVGLKAGLSGELNRSRTFLAFIPYTYLRGLQLLDRTNQSKTDKSQVSCHSITGVSWRKTIGSQT
jgi:hypothetical protein